MYALRYFSAISLTYNMSEICCNFKEDVMSRPITDYVKVQMPTHQVLPLTGYIFEVSYSTSATRANNT